MKFKILYDIRKKRQMICQWIDKLFNSIYIKFRHFLNNYGYWLFAGVILILAIVARYCFVRYPSNDLHWCIFKWIENFRNNGGLTYLSAMQGDYPPFYMTLLALISYLPKGPAVSGYGNSYYDNYNLYDMIYVKSLSFIFDILLAIGIYKIVKLYHKDNKPLCLAAFAIPLFLPTVFTNSAIWGQCDSMYVGLVVWCVYCALNGSFFKSGVFLGLAFAHKLQAIFIIPFLGYLWLRNRYQLRSFIVAGLVLFITFIPCLLAGASLSSALGKYGTLTIEYPDPNYNSGSLYTFIQNIYYSASDNIYKTQTYNLIHYTGMFFGLAVTIMALVIIFKKNIKPTKEAMTGVAALFAMLMPFVLPHMHERYFFMGEIMVVVYCLTSKKKYYLIPLVQLSGIITYMPYIFNSDFFPSNSLFSLRVASIINFIIIYIIWMDIMKNPRYKEELEDINQLVAEKRG